MALAAFKKLLSEIDLHHNFSPVKDVFRVFDFYDSYFSNESLSGNPQLNFGEQTTIRFPIIMRIFHLKVSCLVNQMVLT